MAILLQTTTITVMGHRPQLIVDPDAEGYDPPAEPPAVLVTGHPASIAQPKSARGSATGGVADETDDYSLRCNIFADGITRYDTVIDETTGDEYEVRIAVVSHATLFGLQHIKATLRKREGLKSSAPTNT